MKISEIGQKGVGPRQMTAYLSHNCLFATESFEVNEFFLYSSVLNAKGAKHYIEQGYGLGF
jgi:hypothetical protein